MNREKLNRVADMLAGDTYDAESRLCFIYGVVACADWLMEQPLSERLTDEEKERIKAIYFRNVYSVADVQSNFTEKCLIDALFGADLFREK